ncbi:MAG: hypothetical protein JXR61_07875, partial [Prolixibacteraceae bacterium]|nr:hypothetical protein [Prolixibacteraceae bacterium]
KPRLIHKTHMTYLPTTLPVNFYGFPDGKVYLIYSRFYEINFDKSGLEFVFAEHEEFYYDYNSDKLILKNNVQKHFQFSPEQVDKPDPIIKVIKVYRSINSYNEAQKILYNLTAK